MHKQELKRVQSALLEEFSQGSLKTSTNRQLSQKLQRSRKSWYGTSAGSGKKKPTDTHLDKWGRPLLKRVHFFRPELDYDEQTNTVKATAKMFAAKVQDLPNDGGLAE